VTVFGQQSGDVAHGIAESLEESSRDRLAIEGQIEDPLDRAAGREKVQAIDGVRRRSMTINVEAAQTSARGDVVYRE
jgi:hypothetical protein